MLNFDVDELVVELECTMLDAEADVPWSDEDLYEGIHETAHRLADNHHDVIMYSNALRLCAETDGPDLAEAESMLSELGCVNEETTLMQHATLVAYHIVYNRVRDMLTDWAMANPGPESD